MKIHEYQAKELFAEYGLLVPRGRLVTHPLEAYEAAEELDADLYVVKAQIHAGGRGKAGGVKLAHSAADAGKIAEEMFGKVLVTHQTGPEGKEVKKIYITEGVQIVKEYYLALLVDRTSRRPAIMASTEGGMDIEQVAMETPQKIIIETTHHATELSSFTARKIAFGLGFTGKMVGKFVKVIENLYRMFLEKNCSLIEINPLVLTPEEDLVAVDAKVTIDDNALPRHPELRRLRDYDEEDPLETMARHFGVDYVKLDGQIGCMVNGAGLAMGTMDLIKLYGGEPANFLDIKGGANRQNVVNAFKLLNGHPSVKVILINIFGGIVRCDMVASGILGAMEEVEVKVPIVVRIEGTNSEEGRKLLVESPHPFIIAENLEDAAKRAVAALPGGAA